MEDQIRSLVQRHGSLDIDVTTIDADADLYKAGLSSFASVQLMLGLEDAFGIEFPESLLTRRSFASIAAIKATVEKLVHEQETVK
ncbi:acyl carrier protein [Chthonobacter albigriseus]|uniref:acyl carrier protein n=1 Tax=Chthonobacter albigriseus TaxID=1683161 RepID=UPI0015EE4ECF|nr:acyl carrier protein [Chthonobacter albigriseus]